MTVVVTGASGHLGANLVRALVARGRKVRALVRVSGRALEGLPIETISGDVLDPASLRRALDGAHSVFHLAALISISGDRGGRVPAVNVGGARNVAEAALACGVRRMVHLSSIHAFDMATGDVIDEGSRRADSPGHSAYDRSKAAGERAVRAVIERGLDAVILHPTGVIGPHDHELSRMGKMFLSLYQRTLPSLVSGGFDWVDVRDVVACALSAEERGRTGQSYIVPGHWHSLRELADIASELTGVAPPRITVPIPLAKVGVPFAAAAGAVLGKEPLYTSESLAVLQGGRRIDGSKAATELGHAPRPVRESVRDLYTWFAETGRIPRDAVRF